MNLDQVKPVALYWMDKQLTIFFSSKMRMTEDTLKAGEKMLQSIHFTPPTPVSTNSIY